VPLALASAVFLGPSPLGLATVFDCLRFETSLFIASYDSQGHGGGIRPRLHTGDGPPGLGPSLYSLGADPTENTASSNSSVIMGGCLAITRILLACLPAVTKQLMSLLTIIA
jgi:hypothetical protein